MINNLVKFILLLIMFIICSVTLSVSKYGNSQNGTLKCSIAKPFVNLEVLSQDDNTIKAQILNYDESNINEIKLAYYLKFEGNFSDITDIKLYKDNVLINLSYTDSNTILSEVCRKELEDIKEPLLDGMPIDFGGEDLGNVSRKIPICNPYVTIFPDYKISNHTENFRQLAGSEAGKRCVLVTMKCLSRTVVQLLSDPSIINQAKEELKVRMEDELKAASTN